METDGYPTFQAGLESTSVVPISDTPPSTKLDDEPIHDTTLLLPAILTPYPYKCKITLLTNSPVSYGLLLLASRQAKWTAPIPDEIIPTHLPTDVRRSLLTHIATILRTNTTPPRPSRDQCAIYSSAFSSLSPTECLRYMRTAALHTLLRYLSAKEYKRPHDSATKAAHLSPPTQALLQALNYIQPTTRWAHNNAARTMTFTPIEID